MKTIDAGVLQGYNAGIERGRLHTDLGLIEFQRTKELLAECLPQPPAVVYDIGGGYGEYAWHLAAQGYDVYLYDIAQTNITMAAELAQAYPGVRLRGLAVADARSIDRADGSADAILLMGPLYHIVAREERLAALRECFRLLKPGGKLFAAAITRYATTLWAMTTYGTRNNFLDEPAFSAMLYRELSDGQHIRPEDSAYKGMGRSFFHLPGELRDEIEAAGFKQADVRGVVGCGWLAPNLDALWKDAERRERIMGIVRRLEKDESLMGLSTHLLAIAEK